MSETPDRNEEPRYTEDELQSRIEDAMQRAITVNVNQVQSSQGPNVYPGIGAGWHILHLVLTLFTGFWLFIWIAHVIIARSNWRAENND